MSNAILCKQSMNRLLQPKSSFISVLIISAYCKLQVFPGLNMKSSHEESIFYFVALKTYHDYQGETEMFRFLTGLIYTRNTIISLRNSTFS